MGTWAKQSKVGNSDGGDGEPTNNILALKAGRPKAQSKAAVPTRALPDRPGRNVHPAGQPKPRRSKEEVEVEREARMKELEDLMHIARMAQEDIARLNLMEEVEDDLPRHLSLKIQKRPYTDIEADSEDEYFNLRDAENGSDSDSSESDNATKAKMRVSVQHHIQTRPSVTHPSSRPRVENASRVLLVKSLW